MTNSEIGEILWTTLLDSQPPHTENTYDEVLREVSERTAHEGSMGKSDIGALVVWKRSTANSPWSGKLMNTPEAAVRKITAEAYRIVNDPSKSTPQAGSEARSVLSSVPGLRGTGAIASAVLLAMSPSRMAIWDRRVKATLVSMGMTQKGGKGWYGRYLETLLGLAEAMQKAPGVTHEIIPREVDLALFHAANKPDVIHRLKGAADTSVRR